MTSLIRQGLLSAPGKTGGVSFDQALVYSGLFFCLAYGGISLPNDANSRTAYLRAICLSVTIALLLVLVITFLLILVGMNRAQALGMTFGTVTLAYFSIIPRIQHWAGDRAETTQLDFAITQMTALLGTSAQSVVPLWTYIPNTANGPVLIPSNAAVFLQVLNRRDYPLLVNGISAELLADGKWIKINRVSTRDGGGEIFAGQMSPNCQNSLSTKTSVATWRNR